MYTHPGEATGSVPIHDNRSFGLFHVVDFPEQRIGCFNSGAPTDREVTRQDPHLWVSGSERTQRQGCHREHEAGIVLSPAYTELTRTSAAQANLARQTRPSQSLVEIGRVGRHEADEIQPTGDSEVRLEAHEPRSGITHLAISSGSSGRRREPDRDALIVGPVVARALAAGADRPRSWLSGTGSRRVVRPLRPGRHAR